MIIEDDTYPRYVQVQSNKTGRTRTITLPSAFCNIIGIDKRDTLKVSLKDGRRLLVEKMY
jgi:sugar lactone lactonase YvrE